MREGGEGMIKGYWLLQIMWGEPALRGPFASGAEREHELDMCLVDSGVEYIILIDPDDPPHAWKPSAACLDDRRRRLEEPTP